MKNKQTNIYIHFCYLSIVLLSFLLTSIQAQQQNSGIITGLVKDSETGEAIPNANVFLTNTTFGCASNLEGKFILKKLPAGLYDLVVSYIGYELKVVHITLHDNENLTFDINLKPKIINLHQVNVHAEFPDEWKHLLEKFTQEFLGQTTNAHYCKILNPEVINLFKDSTGTLRAASDSLILIQNNALGYRIKIILHKFLYKNDLTQFVFYPLFEELHSVDKQEEIEWKENRLKTYKGSLRHFLRSAINKKLDDDYFSLSHGYMNINYFNYLSPDDLEVDPLDYDNSLMKMEFPDFLRVIYKGTSDDNISIIKLEKPFILIDKHGNPLDPLAITEYGYWSRQRMSDQLPIDYEPEEE